MPRPIHQFDIDDWAQRVARLEPAILDQIIAHGVAVLQRLGEHGVTDVGRSDAAIGDHREQVCPLLDWVYATDAVDHDAELVFNSATDQISAVLEDYLPVIVNRVIVWRLLPVCQLKRELLRATEDWCSDVVGRSLEDDLIGVLARLAEVEFVLATLNVARDRR